MKSERYLKERTKIVGFLVVVVVVLGVIHGWLYRVLCFHTHTHTHTCVCAVCASSVGVDGVMTGSAILSKH